MLGTITEIGEMCSVGPKGPDPALFIAPVTCLLHLVPEWCPLLSQTELTEAHKNDVNASRTLCLKRNKIAFICFQLPVGANLGRLH